MAPQRLHTEVPKRLMIEASNLVRGSAPGTEVFELLEVAAVDHGLFLPRRAAGSIQIPSNFRALPPAMAAMVD